MRYKAGASFVRIIYGNHFHGQIVGFSDKSRVMVRCTWSDDMAPHPNPPQVGSTIIWPVSALDDCEFFDNESPAQCS